MKVPKQNEEAVFIRLERQKNDDFSKMLLRVALLVLTYYNISNIFITDWWLWMCTAHLGLILRIQILMD